MKLYKLNNSVVIEKDGEYYLREDEDWDQFVNDDHLYEKVKRITATAEAADDGKELLSGELEPPLQSQEIWASGVTYYSSRLARQEESKEAGGGDFYARVYRAERPELFFKATRHRTVGSGGRVRLRRDSGWDVPEPELTLMVTSGGTIVGYTVGNDMSSRSIEGENPLYLPQAKTWDGSAAVGPGISVGRGPLPADTTVEMNILRDGKTVFEGSVGIDQIKRSLESLVSYLYRECTFPCGCLLMTGTGIVPPKEFTLRSGDEIRITIEPIGTLINTVE